MLEDILHTCVDCGTNYLFTVVEQQDFAAQGFTQQPKRCPACRAVRKVARTEKLAKLKAAKIAYRAAHPEEFNKPQAQPQPQVAPAPAAIGFRPPHQVGTDTRTGGARSGGYDSYRSNYNSSPNSNYGSRDRGRSDDRRGGGGGYGRDRGGYGRGVRDQGRSFERPRLQLFPAVCAACGVTTEVPFKPTGIKPVYCRNCFQTMKNQPEANANQQPPAAPAPAENI